MRTHHKNTPQHPYGSSSIENLLGVLIFAVLAVVIAIEFSPMKEWEKRRLDKQNLVELNALTERFAIQSGSPPDRYLTELNTHGFTKSRLLITPYGGYYQYEPALQKVTNPQAPNIH